MDLFKRALEIFCFMAIARSFEKNCHVINFKKAIKNYILPQLV